MAWSVLKLEPPLSYGNVLSPVPKVMLQIIPGSRRGRCDYHHLTDEETESHRREGLGPGSHRAFGAELEIEPRAPVLLGIAFFLLPWDLT